MERKSYPTDLSDAEWACLAPHVPAPKSGGRPPKHTRREIVNAIFYIIRSGEPWRLLPHDLPAWQTVYHYFRLWRLDGTWERIHTTLRERLRVKVGRNAQPSAGILDSQSVKTTGVGGERGYDGAKKLNGRKRHLLVDTQGLVLRAKVHRADLQDRAAVPLVLENVDDVHPRIEHVWVDQGYNGTGKTWIEDHLRWTVEVVRHPPKPRGVWAPIDAVIDWDALIPKGFRGVLPRRWVVERTFGWLLQSRRLSKDYERLCETSEALIYATMTRLMVRRMARL
ncbi:MAG TPA: IS5 family transposase [Blastocatellia bacterium]|nr:IS5 family transposase [Blastocatellia bacterium]